MIFSLFSTLCPSSSCSFFFFRRRRHTRALFVSLEFRRVLSLSHTHSRAHTHTHTHTYTTHTHQHTHTHTHTYIHHTHTHTHSLTLTQTYIITLSYILYLPVNNTHSKVHPYANTHKCPPPPHTYRDPQKHTQGPRLTESSRENGGGEERNNGILIVGLHFKASPLHNTVFR